LSKKQRNQPKAQPAKPIQIQASKACGVAEPVLTFLGGAGTVTGSCCWAQTPAGCFLVDCGFFQGGHEGDQLPRMVFRPREIKAVVLTHAHLDHSGMLPWLCKSGFYGPIFATPGTRDLCQVMLADSAHLQLEEAQYQRKKGLEAREPLYTPEDIPETMSRFVAMDYGWPFQAAPDVQAEFYDAGHILGAASVRLTGDERQVVFSGDLGQGGRPIIRDPDPPPEAKTVVMEATYGDRVHQPYKESVEELRQAILRVAKRRGVIMIPVFAVGRSQNIIYELGDMFRNGKLPKMPVYLDSPLAIESVEVFRRHEEYFDDEAKALIAKGIDPLSFDGLHFCGTVDDSKALNNLAGPAIIMAGSGMCTGGRIRHHFFNRLADEKDAVIFVGFQAEGTLGRILTDGATQVKLQGEMISVRAEIINIEGFSAHADQTGLIGWLKHIKGVKRLFLNHAEPKAAEALTAKALEERLPAPHVLSQQETIDM
jgi:metallo-beta-lactamase family protein